MSEAVELGKLALEICKREVRGFDERGPSLQTDIHRAVIAALSVNRLRDKPAEGEPVACPDREAAIEAAARAYHITHFAPRAETLNGKPCVAFERLLPELQASHRKHVTPIVDAILALLSASDGAGHKETPDA